MSTLMQQAAHIPLVEVTRGAHVESVHAGSVAVVDTAGRLLYSAGDPDCLTFTRSTIKPFQAAPFLLGGGVERFGLDSREIALLCASHSGEAAHVAVVRSILEKAGCRESQLRCGCHVPLRYSLEALPPAGEAFTQLHHNCSGKHAGFLAYCTQHRMPLDSYLSPDHPLQQAVRRSVAAYAGMEEAALQDGTDGCSAPNYAMPLSRLALAYATLASGASAASGAADRTGAADTARAGGDANAAARVDAKTTSILRDAMMAHPELVSGSGRSDLAFMQAAPGDWVAKIGADGVQAIGIRSAGIGIAIKVADGGARAIATAAVGVLQQLGLLPEAASSPLAPWVRPQLRSYSGLHTGEVRSVVALSPRL